ncbi:hypothetical protein JW921_00040, partial [Candidatus Fermentibacterales bacterium]|nr:hypothetical protein [Candidatus Fermentibacterales bacterium]
MVLATGLALGLTLVLRSSGRSFYGSRLPALGGVMALPLTLSILTLLVAYLRSRGGIFSGEKGRARILTSRVRARNSRFTVYDLEIELTTRDGGTRPVRLQRKAWQMDTTDYSGGLLYSVFYNPKKPSQMTFYDRLEEQSVHAEEGAAEEQQVLCPKCGSVMRVSGRDPDSSVCEFCGSASALESPRESRGETVAGRLLPGFGSPGLQEAAIGQLRDIVMEGRTEEAKRLFVAIFDADESKAGRAVDFLATGRWVRELGVTVSPPTDLGMSDLEARDPRPGRIDSGVSVAAAALFFMAVVVTGALAMPGAEELRIWFMVMAPLAVFGTLAWLSELGTCGGGRVPDRRTAVAAPARITGVKVRSTSKDRVALDLDLEVRPHGIHSFTARSGLRASSAQAC